VGFFIAKLLRKIKHPRAVIGFQMCIKLAFAEQKSPWNPHQSYKTRLDALSTELPGLEVLEALFYQHYSHFIKLACSADCWLLRNS
jgi:hypothetical protein